VVGAVNAGRASIRPATRADLDGLLALEAGAFAHDRAERRAIRHAIDSPTITLLVAEEGGAVAGAATVEHRRGSGVARLTSVAVAPDRLGRGLGARLLAEAEAGARARGADRLRLEVRADNAAAIRLYERAGYHRFKVVPRYYEDGASAWRFEKALAAEAR
jgi:[ribosomal protein S18]-alanine N-acetyltransferase